jgi:hypothetical protein
MKKQGGGTREFVNFRWNEWKFRAKFKQPPRVAARLPVTEFVSRLLIGQSMTTQRSLYGEASQERI